MLNPAQLLLRPPLDTEPVDPQGEKRRAADRARKRATRARIKADPEAYAHQKAKWHEYYVTQKRKGNR